MTCKESLETVVPACGPVTHIDSAFGPGILLLCALTWPEALTLSSCLNLPLASSPEGDSHSPTHPYFTPPLTTLSMSPTHAPTCALPPSHATRAPGSWPSWRSTAWASTTPACCARTATWWSASSGRAFSRWGRCATSLIPYTLIRSNLADDLFGRARSRCVAQALSPRNSSSSGQAASRVMLLRGSHPFAQSSPRPV